MADGVEMDTKPEYDFHLDWYSRLAQRQADLEKEKNADVEVYICVRFTVVFPIFMSSNTIVMCVTSPSFI